MMMLLAIGTINCDFSLYHLLFMAVNKKTAKGKLTFGSLAICTHSICRPITLRPHLTAGLPFRLEIY